MTGKIIDGIDSNTSPVFIKYVVLFLFHRTLFHPHFDPHCNGCLFVRHSLFIEDDLRNAVQKLALRDMR